MFSKRPDKYTTGLINMRNDCFANSSVQAYSALPGLTDYLNKMLGTFNEVLEALTKCGADLDQVVLPKTISLVSQSKSNQKDENPEPKPTSHLFSLRLHLALAKIVSKLQDTQMTSRTVSVWTFLHEIERIYNAKISRSQHDAHELTQLINETLESENIMCVKILRLIKEHFASNAELCKKLSELEFAEFPFNGLVLSQMKCLNCTFVSRPNISPFLMLTLHPPQETSTDLGKLLDENESETITEYHCLKCRLSKIVANEKLWKDQGNANSESEDALVNKLINYNNEEHLFINEDLSNELEEYLRNYNKLGLDISQVKSTVFRQTHILKPPKVFGIHLSRSAFNGVTVSRNPCRVTFNDKLSLSIDESYLIDLQKFQNETSDASVPLVKSGTRVLTTDVDDMEDETVQNEDVDLKGDDTDDNTDNLESSDAESEVHDDSESSSLESVSETLNNQSKVETLNSAPITEDQTQHLRRHFRKFNFNENNIYKYRLKAVIRHQGSHTQGHYECYRRKPLFVKDSEGNIIKLSPEIDQEKVLETDKFEAQLSGPKPRSDSHSSADSQDTVEGDKANFRRKLSLMMGRRPSIIQADPTEANLQEFIDSGLATPAEVLVDGGDYFSAPSAQDIQKSFDKFSKTQTAQKTPKIKMKKIPSLIKHPYWKIGDSQVTEVSKSAVLFETLSVYMLYFERVDRPQVRKVDASAAKSRA